MKLRLHICFVNGKPRFELPDGTEVELPEGAQLHLSGSGHINGAAMTLGTTVHESYSWMPSQRKEKSGA